MGTHSETVGRERVSRGLLTSGERDFLTGEKDVSDPDGYLYNTRSRFRSRMEKLEEDLEILREAGEEELVEEFYDKFGRVERLERELHELRSELDDDE